jgi:hypothetical protein
VATVPGVTPAPPTVAVPTIPASKAVEAITKIRKDRGITRTYVGRLIHVDATLLKKTLLGAASHAAWCILALKYKTQRLRGYDKFKEHKQLTGAIVKAWIWEIIEPAIKADLALYGVTA